MLEQKNKLSCTIFHIFHFLELTSDNGASAVPDNAAVEVVTDGFEELNVETNSSPISQGNREQIHYSFLYMINPSDNSHIGILNENV